MWCCLGSWARRSSVNSQQRRVSPLDSRCSSPTQQTARSRRRTCPNLTVTVPSYFSRLKSSAIDENATTASDEFKQRYHDASPANDNDQTAPPASRLMAQTDTPPMLRSRSVPAPTIPSTTTALERPSALAVPLSDSTVSSSSDTVQLGATLATNTPPVEFTPLFDESGVVVGSPSGGSVTAEEVPGDDLEPITADSEGRHYFGAEYRGDILSHVANWNFPIFDLAASTEHVLSQMAFKIFHDTGLFDTFNIPRQEFVRYMVLLESGYRPIPYHNRIHAADVLHGCWYLTTQEIAGFHQYSTIFSSDSSDSDSGTAGSNTRGQINHCTSVGGEVAGSLAQVIPALELMSLYLAAAMHDYDHPGRTNAFLVETRHPLAVMYNDRSVLENHHAAASWQLLYSDPKFDFLRNLDTAEWKRLRFLVIQAILSTDLKKHFDILSQFNSKAQHQQHRSRSPTEGVCDDQSLQQQRDLGIDWSCDEDRLLVCQMAIKLADIGGPAKEQTLHITWTKAICEEFFIQGDEERQLGVPVSPFMDRERPEVAELQRTFINNLIRPIVLSMYKAGLLAGETVDANDASDDETAETCLLVDQLNSNLAYWKTKTQSGFEEMREAFKLAHPVDLDRAASRSTRNRRRSVSASASFEISRWPHFSRYGPTAPSHLPAHLLIRPRPQQRQQAGGRYSASCKSRQRFIQRQQQEQRARCSRSVHNQQQLPAGKRDHVGNVGGRRGGSSSRVRP